MDVSRDTQIGGVSARVRVFHRLASARRLENTQAVVRLLGSRYKAANEGHAPIVEE